MRMLRRILIWALSAALATAPLAPAWAMARKAFPVVAGIDSISLASSAGAGEAHSAVFAPAAHAYRSNRPGSAYSAAANYSAANEIHRAHPPSLAESRLARATHADSGAAVTDVHARSGLDANQFAEQNANKTSIACSDDGTCDGQCCGVCILTLGGLIPFTKIVAFGANDSPSYRGLTYTSFVPTLLGRPPQL